MDEYIFEKDALLTTVGKGLYGIGRLAWGAGKLGAKAAWAPTRIFGAGKFNRALGLGLTGTTAAGAYGTFRKPGQFRSEAMTSPSTTSVQAPHIPKYGSLAAMLEKRAAGVSIEELARRVAAHLGPGVADEVYPRVANRVAASEAGLLQKMEQGFASLAKQVAEKPKEIPTFATATKKALKFAPVVALAGLGLGMGTQVADRIVNKSLLGITRESDFGKMLDADAQWSQPGLSLKETMSTPEGARKVQMAFQTVRNVNPKIGRDPLLAGAAVKRMVRRSEDVFGTATELGRIQTQPLYETADTGVKAIGDAAKLGLVG